MKRLMISAFAAVALLAVATTVLWSRSMGHPVERAGLIALYQMHSGAYVNKLPIEEIEDQSLVFSAAAKP